MVTRRHITNIRDKNVRLIGGVLDLNKTGNPQANSNYDVNPQLWSGIGIVFKGVENLTIEKIKDIGNEWKYCFLITDVNNFKGNNINMNNGSNALHFQPPLKNVNSENISGNIDDDLLSFIMGDYTNYIVGTTGDIENVYIRNVHANDTD